MGVTLGFVNLDEFGERIEAFGGYGIGGFIGGLAEIIGAESVVAQFGQSSSKVFCESERESGGGQDIVEVKFAG